MMQRFGITWSGLVLTALLATLAGSAVAQNRVIANQGRPGQEGAWPVTISSSGAGVVSTTPATCGGATHRVTSVGVAAVSTPAAQLASRRFVTLCVSLENSSNPTVKCRIDGTNPVMGNTNVGDTLGIGDCITYPVAAATVPKCIADSASTAVTSLECT